MFISVTTEDTATSSISSKMGTYLTSLQTSTIKGRVECVYWKLKLNIKYIRIFEVFKIPQENILYIFIDIWVCIIFSYFPFKLYFNFLYPHFKFPPINGNSNSNRFVVIYGGCYTYLLPSKWWGLRPSMTYSMIYILIACIASFFLSGILCATLSRFWMYSRRGFWFVFVVFNVCWISIQSADCETFKSPMVEYICMCICRFVKIIFLYTSKMA